MNGEFFSLSTPSDMSKHKTFNFYKSNTRCIEYLYVDAERTLLKRQFLPPFFGFMKKLFTRSERETEEEELMKAKISITQKSMRNMINF